MGGRVVEGTGLENRQAGDRLVGSNPTPSATRFSFEDSYSMTQPHNKVGCAGINVNIFPSIHPRQ